MRFKLMKTYWYQEPWAWLVFILPFIAVVAGIATYIIANNEPDSLVVGDYYKEGKAINVQLSKIKLAQKLGIKFDLYLSDNNLLIKPTGIEKTFPLLNVNFFHPTQETKDFSLVLTPDGNGDFRHDFSDVIDTSQEVRELTGKWRITLTPFENTWKIQNTIHLSQNSTIEIVPDTTQAN